MSTTIEVHSLYICPHLREFLFLHLKIKEWDEIIWESFSHRFQPSLWPVHIRGWCRVNFGEQPTLKICTEFAFKLAVISTAQQYRSSFVTSNKEHMFLIFIGLWSSCHCPRRPTRVLISSCLFLIHVLLKKNFQDVTLHRFC